MLTQVKQQVQETSCTLKKYRQAFSKNVAKGFKMVAGTTSASKDASDSDQLSDNKSQIDAAANEAKAVSNTASDPAWLRSVEQMGFSRTEVLEAAGAISDHPSPSEIDDLVQVLLVMSTSRTASTCDVAADILHAPTQEASTLPKQPFQEPLPPLSPPPTELAAAPMAITPQAYLEEMPPMPAMSAVGSVEFEMAVDKDSVLHAKRHPMQASLTQSSLLHKAPPTVTLATRLALEQMGFESDAIEEASRLLGPAAQFHDLVDLLSNQASRRCGPKVSACPAASKAVQESDAFENKLLQEMRKARGEISTDSEDEDIKDVEVFHRSSGAMEKHCSEDTKEGEVPAALDEMLDLKQRVKAALAHAAHTGSLAAALAEMEEQEAHEVSSCALATTVVAMVLANVSEKMVLQTGEKKVANKQGVDESFPVSPKRGGA